MLSLLLIEEFRASYKDIIGLVLFNILYKLTLLIFCFILYDVQCLYLLL